MATDTTEQIVREAPEVEAYKLNLMKAASQLQAPTLPGYQIAGMSPQQTAAIQQGQAGIGAYAPYMQAGQENVAGGASTLGEAADVLRGSDTRAQFGAAQEAYNQAAVPAQNMGQYSNLAGAGYSNLNAAGEGLANAQNMAMAASGADLIPSQMLQLQSADMANQAANQSGFGQGQGALQQGIGALSGAAQQYDPNSVQNFMNPYQQNVIDNALQQINRQAGIDQTNLQSQATRAGAFGGAREGIQRAELNRNTQQMRDQAIMSGLQSGYNTAQGQSMQAFQNQQANQLAQGQGLTQAGSTAGNLASQQGQLGLSAAQQAGAVGQNIGAQNVQQAQLGQGAANLYGNMASQQGAIGSQYANIAGQQANIANQQSQTLQNLGQGIGNLANQQFGIGQNMAQGLGSLGTQLGNMGVQQAALGQTEQQLGQQDTNFLYNLGAQQQKQQQAVLDAQRATSMQTAMQPYQQLAFQSDIYKGAPSSQMAVTTQQAPAPSPFQQIAGVGTGILGTAAAANAVGKIF